MFWFLVGVTLVRAMVGVTLVRAMVGVTLGRAMVGGNGCNAFGLGSRL